MALIYEVPNHSQNTSYNGLILLSPAVQVLALSAILRRRLFEPGCCRWPSTREDIVTCGHIRGTLSVKSPRPHDDHSHQSRHTARRPLGDFDQSCVT